MKVRVEATWSGNEHYGFDLTVERTNQRFRIRNDGGEWTRRDAVNALDLLQAEGFDRSTIRFVHH